MGSLVVKEVSADHHHDHFDAGSNVARDGSSIPPDERPIRVMKEDRVDGVRANCSTLQYDFLFKSTIGSRLKRTGSKSQLDR